MRPAAELAYHHAAGDIGDIAWFAGYPGRILPSTGMTELYHHRC